MEFRKLIVIFSFLLLACLVIMQVSADENVTYSNETKNITFEGINFTIPEGFGESKADEDFFDLGSDGKTCFYINEANGEIVITVISDWMGMSLEELEKDNSTKAEINGHDGWNYTEDELHCFGYMQGEKAVIVGVTNETRLSQVIL